MLANKNQRPSGYNQSAINSYLQPYQQYTSANQNNLSSQLQQKDNNRGSLQKAISPTRNSTHKQYSSFKQNQKNQSHNSFKEDTSVNSKIGTSSSLLKNGNGIIGGGQYDVNKSKGENSLSPCIKSTNLQKNGLLSPQLMKQSTQNLSYLINKNKESKSTEPQTSQSYLKDTQQKQIQKIDHSNMYQTPQSLSKTNIQSGNNEIGLQSQQQYTQSQNQASIYKNTQNSPNTTYGNIVNNNLQTPSNYNKNICTINLCDKQDLFQNINLACNTNNKSINDINNKLELSSNNPQRSPSTYQQSNSNNNQSSNKILIQPISKQSSAINTENGLLKSNQLQQMQSSKNYFGYLRSGSQQQQNQSSVRNVLQQQQSNSSDAKFNLQQKTKYIDLQSTIQSKKQGSQLQYQHQQLTQQQQIQQIQSYLNQSNKTDQSSQNPFNNMSNNSILLSKSSQNGFGSIVSNQHNIITSSQESDKDHNIKKLNNPLTSNSVTSSKSSMNANPISYLQKQDSNHQKSGIQVQLTESRSLDQVFSGSDSQKRLNVTSVNHEQQSPTIVQLKCDMQQKSSSLSPYRESRQQINVLQECDSNTNQICQVCKTKKANYQINISDISKQYFCSKCSIEQSKFNSNSSNPITNNSISTGIGGSAAESYLSPQKINITSTPINLQTIDLRTDLNNHSPATSLQNESTKKGQTDQLHQFQNFANIKTTNYINQVIPLEQKSSEFQIPQSSQYINSKIDIKQIADIPSYTPLKAINANNQVNQKQITNNDQISQQLQKPNQQILQQSNTHNLNQPILNGYTQDFQSSNQQPISQALSEFKSQIAQTFDTVQSLTSQNSNFSLQDVQNNQNPQVNNNQNVLFDKQSQVSNNYQSNELNKFQSPIYQINDFMGEEEKIKRQKLNDFQAKLFRIKNDFDQLQKQFYEKNDSLIQEYHKNIESVDYIQKSLVNVIEEVASRQKEVLLNNFNDNLAKYKNSKFEIQQILNYLNCTENDLMSNFDSILRDMDIDSLDDIIGQYNLIIQQYEESRTKKFLSQLFVVQQLKYANDGNQLASVSQKMQDVVNHLLTIISYTQNIQKSQVSSNQTLYGTTEPNAKVQQFQLQQNSFINQQPKSIYVSFENRDIFQSAAHSTTDQHHPETQPQSPSFKATLSQQNQLNMHQSQQNGFQFLTFKEIINNEEQNQQNNKIQNQMQSSQQNQQNNNLVVSKHFYSSNGDIIQRSSFGSENNKQEQSDSPLSTKPQLIPNNYSTYQSSPKQVLLTMEDEDSSKKGNYYSNLNMSNQGIGGIAAQQSLQLNQNITQNIHLYNNQIPSYQNNSQIQNAQQINSTSQATNLQQYDAEIKKLEDLRISNQKLQLDGLEINSMTSPTNKIIYRSQENPFSKINTLVKNYNNEAINLSSNSQNYGLQSENQSIDYIFNQSTTTSASNNNTSNHNHSLLFKNKQKYNDLLQKIQVNQSQTEKLCTDVLSSGQNFKFSQQEENQNNPNPQLSQSIQSGFPKK
ncbi:hypothetical protein TTHERM_00693190 (macronuclear) [Tetrahymena thermophila SB210]|uniref:Uncharacterized protein n=1 Tax=Tetrahymena thermophila (strain SB210) TaxID=312017 RepID=Q244Z8_TETTS|nr:hypothetical protein TTHERM_00693190 [Tetrahymena thermophila SB210]EAS03339.1 hypothetical protein TTHERM_00693190 [Tetrahymena thermophila SB210]|eukprot:XP_001023584.1 hypothetical protein TTHERM_00693190 [Tetrahymena thermophila SB210]